MQDINRLGSGDGLHKADLGIRPRYEIAREFALDIGVKRSWPIMPARRAGCPCDQRGGRGGGLVLRVLAGTIASLTEVLLPSQPVKAPWIRSCGH